MVGATRSPRDVHEHYPRGACGDSVGPGDYYDAAGRWGAEESKTAFQTSSSRPNICRWFNTNLVTPGPGAYNVRRANSSPAVDRPATEPPSSAFRSGGPRITPQVHCPGASEYLPSSIAENPGPGAYTLNRSITTRPDSSLCVEGFSRGPPVVGLSQSMPSFPPLRDPQLVRFSGRGCVVDPRQRIRPEHKDQLGPGDYEHHSQDSKVVNKAGRTADFHASDSNRQLFEPTVAIENTMTDPVNPGPGTYSNISRQLTKSTTQPFLSKTPQLCGNAVTNKIPGPGTYPDEEGASPAAEPAEQPLAFSGARAGSSGRCASWPSQLGVRSDTHRTGWYRPALTQPYSDPDFIFFPGPGYYPKQQSFSGEKMKRARHSRVQANQLRKFHAVHTPHQQIALRDTDGAMLAGFDATEQRGCLVPLREVGVGPGQYSSDESMGQSMQSVLKKRGAVGRRGVFGTCQDRFHGFAAGALDFTGEPGTAPSGPTLLASPGAGAPSKMSFKSGVPKNPRDLAVEDPSLKPAPGNYEAFDGVNYKSKFRRPKTEHLSFGSSSSRWRSKETFAEPPGPGEYEPKSLQSNVGGAAKITTDRKLDQPPPGHPDGLGGDSLGPGKYNVDTSTLLRKTFNASGEDAARKAQGRPPAGAKAATILPGGGAGGGAAGNRSRLKSAPAKREEAVPAN